MRSPLVILLMLLIMTMASTEATAQLHTHADNDLPIKPENFQVGREYFELPTPAVLYDIDDGQVEVLSFYWYNCGACYYMEPAIDQWAKKLPPGVRLVRLPFSHRGPTIFHARLAFALEKLEQGSNINKYVFELFQKKRQPIFTVEELPVLASALHIDEKELTDAFHSPEVDAKMEQLEKVLQAYNLDGVPAMVIDGRYSFDVGTTYGAQNFLELADILIDRRLEARAKK